MSTTIDERVLEMQFDNKDFEKNTGKTLKTLDKLKEALNFGNKDDASKSFDAITVAATKMGNNLSVASIMGITAISRLTNAAITAGERIVKSLTIDQVTAGWDKFVTKTSSVQTIFNATRNGISGAEALAGHMDTVSGAIEKLNWFTDETSFSLIDMTSNIAKFTSAGVELDSATQAMMGIASAAGYAGLNVQSASHAMEGFSKAMAAGYMNRQNWSWIKTAGMDTIAFKQQLIEAGVAAGTLIKTTQTTGKGKNKKTEEVYAVASTTKNGKLTKKSTIVSAENFEESLSDKWLTDKVIEDTLNEYGKFATEAYEAVNAVSGDLWTSDLLGYIDAYKEGGIEAFNALAESNEMLAEDMEVLLPYVEKFSDESYELSIEAFRASQEAKSLSEAIDSWKDAASTQWMLAFEKIIGDYLTAKKLWTDLANWGYEVFVSPLGALNSVVDKWLQFGGRNALFMTPDDAEGAKTTAGAFYLLGDALDNLINPVRSAIEDVFPFFKLLTGNASASDISGFGVALADMSFKFRNFIANLELSDEMSTLLYNSTYALGTAFKTVKGAIVEVFKAIKNTGVIQALGKLLISVGAKLSTIVVDVIDFIKQNDTLQRIWSSLLNVFGSLGNLFDNVRKILSGEIIEDEKYQALSSAISGLKGSLSTLWGSLKDGWAVLSKFLSETFSSLWSIFVELFPQFAEAEGPIDVLRIGLEELSKLATDVFQKISKFWEDHGGPIREFVGKVITWFSGLREKLPEIWQSITTYLTGLWNTFANTEFGSKVISIWNSITQAFTDFVNKIKDGMPIKETFGEFFSGLAEKVKEVWSQLKELPWGLIIAGLVVVAGVIIALILAFRSLQKALSGTDTNAELAQFLDSAKKSLSTLSKAAFIAAIAYAVKTLIEAIVQLTTIVDTGKMVGTLISLGLILGLIVGFIALATKLSTREDGSSSLLGIAATLFGIVFGLLILNRVISQLASMKPETFRSGLGRLSASIASIAGIILGLKTAFQLVASKIGSTESEGEETNDKLEGLRETIFKLALSVLAIVIAMKVINTMSPGQILTGIIAIAGILAALEGFLWLVSKKNAQGGGELDGSALLGLAASILAIGLLIRFSLLPAIQSLAAGDAKANWNAIGQIAALLLVIAAVIFAINYGLREVFGGQAAMARASTKVEKTAAEEIKEYKAKALLIIGIGAAILAIGVAVKLVIDAINTVPIDKFGDVKAILIGLGIFIGLLMIAVGLIIHDTGTYGNRASSWKSLRSVAFILLSIGAMIIAIGFAVKLVFEAAIEAENGISTNGLGVLLSFFTLILAVMVVVALLLNPKTKIQAGRQGTMIGLAAVLLTAGIAIVLIAASLAIVYSAASNFKGDPSVLMGFAAMVVGVLAAIVLISIFGKTSGSKLGDFLGLALLIGAISIGILLMAVAFKTVTDSLNGSTFDISKMWSFLALIGIVLAAVIVMSLISRKIKSLNVLAIAGAFVLLALGMKLILESLSGFKGSSDIGGLKGAIEALMPVLITFMAVFAALVILAGVVPGAGQLIGLFAVLVAAALAGLAFGFAKCVEAITDFFDHSDIIAKGIENIASAIQNNDVLGLVEKLSGYLAFLAQAVGEAGFGLLFATPFMYAAAAVIEALANGATDVSRAFSDFLETLQKIAAEGTDSSGLVTFFNNVGEGLDSLASKLGFFGAVEIATIGSNFDSLGSGIQKLFNAFSIISPEDFERGSSYISALGGPLSELSSSGIDTKKLSSIAEASGLIFDSLAILDRSERADNGENYIAEGVQAICTSLIDFQNKVDDNALMNTAGVVSSLSNMVNTLYSEIDLDKIEIMAGFFDSLAGFSWVALTAELDEASGTSTAGAKFEALGKGLYSFADYYNQALALLETHAEPELLSNVMTSVVETLMNAGFDFTAGVASANKNGTFVGSVLTAFFGKGNMSGFSIPSGSMDGIGTALADMMNGKYGIDINGIMSGDFSSIGLNGNGEGMSTDIFKTIGESLGFDFSNGFNLGITDGIVDVTKNWDVSDIPGIMSNYLNIDGIDEYISPELKKAAADMGIDIDSYLIGMVGGKMAETGTEMAEGVSEGITETIPEVQSSAAELADASYNALVEKDMPGRFTMVGVNAAAGLGQGIANGTGGVVSKVISMVNAAIAAAKSGFDEHSPSKVFFGIGDYVGIGLAEGMRSTYGVVRDSSTGFAKVAIDATESALSGINAALNDNMSPTIRPIIDLSDVEYGANEMRSMLAIDPSSSYKYAASSSSYGSSSNESAGQMNSGTVVNITVTQPTQAWTEYLFNKFNVRFAGVI